MEKLMADSKFSLVEWKMNVWKRIRLTELVKKYSEFIDFPIHLWASKEVEKEVPADEDESVDEDETFMHDSPFLTSSEEEVEEEDAEKADDEKKTKTKKVKETTYEWELLNDMKAIWLRNPKEVTDEEYTKFYHSLAEVIVFTDSVDEYLMQYLMDYEDKKFQNVFKEGLKLKDSKTKELKESFNPLTKWWKTTLASDNVEDVKICHDPSLDPGRDEHPEP
ncbi:Endoplasmin -like protein [Capsicum baccatum]|uniref:Endoplasmin-like protein n=1 Tax=Capsicum baccatum TaxID=33114 RepID=A0A2G2V368_CAPBA|nr:Endoplasmin -like protein [Capsicum baccatum]